MRPGPIDKSQFSFEFFPPRSESAERQLSSALDGLLDIDRKFISVTSGVGDGLPGRTLATISRIKARCKTPVAAHVTAAGYSRPEVDVLLRNYQRAGVNHVLALRGDKSTDRRTNAADEYQDALGLVNAAKQAGIAEVTVAAYPEPHPLANSAEDDLDVLVAKYQAGADRAITQFFFNNGDFLRLRDRLADRGVRKPLVPGILPIVDFAQTCRLARRCGCKIPKWLGRAFERFSDDQQMSRLLAISIAVEQINGLLREGVENFHIYTMNRAEPAREICLTVKDSERSANVLEPVRLALVR